MRDKKKGTWGRGSIELVSSVARGTGALAFVCVCVSRGGQCLVRAVLTEEGALSCRLTPLVGWVGSAGNLPRIEPKDPSREGFGLALGCRGFDRVSLAF